MMDWPPLVLSLILGLILFLLFFYFLLNSRPSLFPPGPPNLPLIGAYPFLSGNGPEKYFGPEVRKVKVCSQSAALALTFNLKYFGLELQISPSSLSQRTDLGLTSGVLFWPSHWSVRRFLPNHRPQRLASCQESFCKRRVLWSAQVRQVFYDSRCKASVF